MTDIPVDATPAYILGWEHGRNVGWTRGFLIGFSAAIGVVVVTAWMLGPWEPASTPPRFAAPDETLCFEWDGREFRQVACGATP